MRDDGVFDGRRGLLRGSAEKGHRILTIGKERGRKALRASLEFL
jgi:hypothetical protein